MLYRTLSTSSQSNPSNHNRPSTSFPTTSSARHLLWMPLSQRLTSSNRGSSRRAVVVRCPPPGVSSFSQPKGETLPQQLPPSSAAHPRPDIRGTTTSDSHPSRPLIKRQALFTAMDPIHVHAVSMTATLAFSAYIDIAQVEVGACWKDDCTTYLDCVLYICTHTKNTPFIMSSLRSCLLSRVDLPTSGTPRTPLSSPSWPPPPLPED